MTVEVLNRRLTNAKGYDMSFHSPLKSDNGWKISIQGKDVSDSIYLYQKLNSFLYKNKIPFKVATANRYKLRNTHKEQSFKSMTIYCPNDIDFNWLCDSVYTRISNYKGWYNIKTPSKYTHYAGGMFIRNDRDVNGKYIPSN